MNADTFSKIASGVQSVAVVVGLATGGWWALKTFVFQNPTFYGNGVEVAGRTPEAIKVEIEAEQLDQATRTYELRLTISNSSKTLSQAVPFQNVDLVFFKPGEATVSHAKFATSQLDEKGLVVPASENRILRFLGQFPSDGIFVLEANPCKRLGTNCFAQKYVSIKAANPSFHRTCAKSRAGR